MTFKIRFIISRVMNEGRYLPFQSGKNVILAIVSVCFINFVRYRLLLYTVGTHRNIVCTERRLNIIMSGENGKTV